MDVNANLKGRRKSGTPSLGPPGYHPIDESLTGRQADVALLIHGPGCTTRHDATHSHPGQRNKLSECSAEQSNDTWT